MKKLLNWRLISVCSFLIFLSGAIQGCPPATPCPCEGEGPNPQFSIVGRWGESMRLPWDSRSNFYQVEIEFFSNNQYTLAFRLGDQVEASESGRYIFNQSSQPPTLDLEPAQASYPSNSAHSSAQNQLNTNLAVVEIQDISRINIGFAGGRDDWGDSRPAGYAVANLRLPLDRRSAKEGNIFLISEQLRLLGF